MFVVRHLVGKHDFDFVFGEPGQQRVAQNDPFGATEAGKCGVRLLRFLAHVHPVYAEHLRPDSLRQHREFLFERFVVEWLQFVEQRQNDDRKNRREHDAEQKKERAGPEPPPVTGAAQHEVQHIEYRDAEQQTQGKRLQLIERPAAECLIR